MNNFVSKILAFSLLFTIAPVLAESPYLEGDFSISGGQAVYDVAIDLPPGRAGHQPKMSINYHSGRNNGFIGVGWSINGLSKIHRCEKNLSTDGLWGGLKLDNDDRYCVDGKRLIAVSGRDGYHLTEYRTEIDDGNKYVSFNRVGNGPQYFKVWTTEGVELTYGDSSDSRLVLSGNVLSWALSSNKDKSKNEIKYKYFNHENTSYIDKISYVGGEVKFIYENRNDYISKYIKSSLIQQKKRLTFVKTYDSNLTEVSYFKFNYKYASKTGKSLLVKLDKSNANQSLKPITFAWSENAQPSSYTQKVFDGSLHSFFDKTRDGKLELAYTEGYEFKVSDSGYRKDMRWNPPLLGIWSKDGYSDVKECHHRNSSECYSADTNNDGISEIVKKPHYDFSGDGRAQLYTEDTYKGIKSKVIDIDGDGLLDRYYFNSDKTSYRRGNSENITYVNNYFSNISIKKYGDRHVDIMHFNCSNSHSSGVSAPRGCYELSKGSTRERFDALEFLDLNNDGYMDMLFRYVYSGSYYIRINNGNDFNSENYLFKDFDLKFKQAIDLNGDGLKELVFSNKENKKTEVIYLNQDITSVKKRNTVNGLVKFYDVNSDGELDKVSNDYYNTVTTVNYANKVKAVDKIEKFSSFANAVNVEYKPISDKSVHTQVKHFRYPVVNTTPVLFVVSKHSSKNGATTYKYEGAKSHVNGGGFLGFSKISSQHVAGGITTKVVSSYEQYRNVGGKKKFLPTGKLTSKLEYKNNKLIASETRSYRHNNINGSNGLTAYLVSLNHQKIEQYDLHGLSLGRVETKFERNKLGRVIKETTNKYDGNNLKYSKVTGRDYISSGTPSYKIVYQSKDTQSSNIVNSLAKYPALDLWCGSNNTKFIKPRDKFTLIHGDVVTPILLERYSVFYRLDISRSANLSVSNTDVKTTRFTKVSAAEFNAKSPTQCGSFYISDYDSDGKQDLGSVSGSMSSLVVEAGDAYWQTSTPKRVSTTLKDEVTGLSRTTVLDMTYSSQGLLQGLSTTSSSYDGGEGSKTQFSRYSYDDFGNLISETKGGTDTQDRINRTEFDAQGLFPRSTYNALDHRVSYEYDKRFGVSSRVTDPNGRTTHNQYDVFGRLIKTLVPGKDNWVKYDYLLGASCPQRNKNAISCVKSESNQRGTTYTQFDYAGREVRSMHQAFDGRWVYVDQLWDINGRKVRESRPSFTAPDAGINNVPHSRFSYDLLNREIYKQEPSDTGNGWHSYNVDYRGFTETIKEDKQGKIFTKSITKNVMGYVINTTEPLGAYQNYTYYPDGKLKSTEDANGSITRIHYDNLGYRMKLLDPDLGDWNYDYNVFGELVYKKDANGNTTKISIDRLGRKVREDIAGRVSTWDYDLRGKGLLHKQTSPGNSKEFFYQNGLLIEEKMEAKGQVLVQRYEYDGFERLAREVRPNSLVLEYIYNNYGYQSAVRSPKDAADDIFTSETFQQDVKTLIQDSIKQAQKYLDLANRYAQQRDFYKNKASELNSKSVDVNQLDSQSFSLLNGAKRFKKYCNSAGSCYLQSATWVLLHDDITIPIDVNLDSYYRINSRYHRTNDGNKYFDTTLHSVLKAEFENSGAKQNDEWLVKDYDGNGTHDLVSRKHIYGAYKDSETQSEINFTAQDLALASRIADARYNTYRDLARNLITLSSQVAELSQLFSQDAKNQGKQKEYLQTILTQSELAKANKSQAYIYYWQRTNTDAFNHTTSEVLGNGLANSYVHSAKTGRARVIATHKASSVVSQAQLYINRHTKNNYRYLRYDYDNWGNVTRRYDMSLGLNETFTYDLLDRVRTSTPTLDKRNQHGFENPDFDRTFDYRYDKLGNIEYKTDVGDYRYQSSHVHAVTQAGNKRFEYDAVGNMIKATELVNNKKVVERELVWSDFNKPIRITRNEHTTSFEYDANQQRFYRDDSTGLQTLYLGKTYEQVIDTKAKSVQHKQYIYADGKLVALNIVQTDSKGALKNKQVRYMHYDALESVDMITDGYGLIVERRSYDPWGKTRKLVWQDVNNPATLTQFTLTNRGFTGHEHLEEVGLIHMNGRVYDQELGRFISADPIIQAPYITNSFNRYTYVMNNPLKYRDPTGYRAELGGGCEIGADASASGGTSNNCGQRKGPSRRGTDYEHSYGESYYNSKDKVLDIKITHYNSPKKEEHFFGSRKTHLEKNGGNRDRAESILDIMQGGFSSAGLVPGWGEPFDVLNAVISFSRGNYGEAALDLLSAGGPIPIAAVTRLNQFSDVAKGIGSYKRVKGHHVHAKAAFKENLAYDPKEGFSISQSFMKENGLDHAAMTKYQRQAFKELYQSGSANTMKAHTRIAVEALQAGGASREMARSLTAQSLNALRNSGVRTPSNIPWYK